MASIQTDGFLTNQGITVNFQPWFASGFRFTRLYLYEEIGGKVAHGEIDLEMDGSEEAINMVTKEKTGTLTLQDENGPNLTIPLFITDAIQEHNYVRMSFLCINAIDFVEVDVTTIWDKPIKKVIEALYPGKIDIRDGCEPDIQNDPLYYQNKETNKEICERLCYSYKKDCIFAFGLEGLLIKDTLGMKNSWGKDEGPDSNKLDIRVNTNETTQRDAFANPNFKRTLYQLPINLWEDTESKAAIKDYTEYEPVNFNIMAKYRERYYMHKDYYQLWYNYTYNWVYQHSKYYQEISVIHRNMPKYKIGDVLLYRNEQFTSEETKWKWKYYLVRSNEIFLSTDHSDMFDEYGQRYGWTSKLVALEENGSFAVGSDTDPAEGLTV